MLPHLRVPIALSHLTTHLFQMNVTTSDLKTPSPSRVFCFANPETRINRKVPALTLVPAIPLCPETVTTGDRNIYLIPPSSSSKSLTPSPHTAQPQALSLTVCAVTPIEPSNLYSS